MTVQDYLDLITSEHRDQPNFVAMVQSQASHAVYLQDLVSAMVPLFDVDSAVGKQLDIIGQWVGVSRNIPIPLSGVYFSWDQTDYIGWDFGSWQPTDQPANITVLPDDAYRTLIRAKIAANKWSGTTEDAYTVWSEVFPDLNILIQDNQDMSYDLILTGGIVGALTLALLTGGFIPLKPEGVKVNNYYVPVDTSPAFGWDLDNSFISGWDTGAWTRAV